MGDRCLMSLMIDAARELPLVFLIDNRLPQSPHSKTPSQESTDKTVKVTKILQAMTLDLNLRFLRKSFVQ